MTALSYLAAYVVGCYFGEAVWMWYNFNGFLEVKDKVAGDLPPGVPSWPRWTVIAVLVAMAPFLPFVMALSWLARGGRP